MESIAMTMVVYFVGWALGFFTAIALVYHVVNKMAAQAPVPEKVKTTVRDLNPHKYE